VKTVKSVAAKSKKLYMLFNITPAKELTGGPWYTEHEFDHEFISELRAVVLEMVKAKGQIGVKEITNALTQCGISKIELSEPDVEQLVTTLLLDGDVEEILGDDGDYMPGRDEDEGNEKLFCLARPGKDHATSTFEFRYWDCLEEDFNFRPMKFGDLGPVSAHEPHHHSN